MAPVLRNVLSEIDIPSPLSASEVSSIGIGVDVMILRTYSSDCLIATIVATQTQISTLSSIRLLCLYFYSLD